MEKKKIKQSSLSAAKYSIGSHKYIPKSTQKVWKKWLNHKKILTQDIQVAKDISFSAHPPKERYSSSQHNQRIQNEKMKTAANTWSTWSNQNNKSLVHQISKLNQQFKRQNERIKYFIKQIQPSFDFKLSCNKYNAITKVSLSQKIKRQCQLLQNIASMSISK